MPAYFAPVMGARPQHTPAYKRLCRHLRRWREESDQTQRDLAVKLKKPHSFVHKVETGQRRIDPVEFVAWCKATDVDPAEGIVDIQGR